jgi:hypothetical protein
MNRSPLPPSTPKPQRRNRHAESALGAMNVNMQSTKHAKWTTRMWRSLAALAEAISVSPMEDLEMRIAALEQEVWAGSKPPRTHKESKPGQNV